MYWDYNCISPGPVQAIADIVNYSSFFLSLRDIVAVKLRKAVPVTKPMLIKWMEVIKHRRI
jgi:hypothetical protein